MRNIEINLQSLRAATTRHVEVLKRYPAIYNLIQNNSNICHASEVSGLTYWLSLAPSLRATHFKNWYNDIVQTVNSVHLFLQLLRQQTEYHQCFSDKGFYSTTTQNHGELLLISVKIPRETPIFPQISAGKSRLSIHFHSLASDDSYIRSSYSGEFQLKYTLQVG